MVVIEMHGRKENWILIKEKIQNIIRDTTSGNWGLLDLGEIYGGARLYLFCLCVYFFDSKYL